jgi:sugar phosphate isomerase/epimerase
MPVTRVGLSTYGLMWCLGSGAEPFEPEPPALTLDELASLAIEWGVDVVQFADNRPLDELDQHERRALIERLHAHGVGIEIAVRGADRAHLTSALDVALDAGSSLLRTVLGTPGVRPITADEAIAHLAPLQERFENAGVVLALENYDHLSTKELARISRTLGPWTGICLDTVNSFGALEGPDVVIATLADLTVNLHAKDFEVVRAVHTMGFSIEGRPAGEGRLDLPGLFERLSGRPDMSAIVELWTPPQESLAATRSLELDWARRSVSHLRSLVA